MVLRFRRLVGDMLRSVGKGPSVRVLRDPRRMPAGRRGGVRERRRDILPGKPNHPVSQLGPREEGHVGERDEDLRPAQHGERDEASRRRRAQLPGMRRFPVEVRGKETEKGMHECRDVFNSID